MQIQLLKVYIEAQYCKLYIFFLYSVVFSAYNAEVLKEKIIDGKSFSKI